MSRLRHVAVPVAVLALVGVGAASSAQAAPARGKATVNVSIGLDGNQSHILGAVTSPKADCKSDRVVKLYYAGPGDTSFRNVASDDSATGGAWTIRGPGGHIPTGRYYVTIAANGKCQAAKSKTIKAAAG